MSQCSGSPVNGSDGSLVPSHSTQPVAPVFRLLVPQGLNLAKRVLVLETQAHRLPLDSRGERGGRVEQRRCSTGVRSQEEEMEEGDMCREGDGEGEE